MTPDHLPSPIASSAVQVLSLSVATQPSYTLAAVMTRLTSPVSSTFSSVYLYSMPPIPVALFSASPATRRSPKVAWHLAIVASTFDCPVNSVASTGSSTFTSIFSLPPLVSVSSSVVTFSIGPSSQLSKSVTPRAERFSSSVASFAIVRVEMMLSTPAMLSVPPVASSAIVSVVILLPEPPILSLPAEASSKPKLLPSPSLMSEPFVSFTSAA